MNNNSPSIPYEDAMAQLYRENPEMASEVLNEAIKEGDQKMFMVILGEIMRGAEKGEKQPATAQSEENIFQNPGVPTV